MGNFKQGKRFGDGGGRKNGFDRREGGRSSFSRGNFKGFGGRDRGSITLHQAICDQCKKPCEVPFRPTEGKPVYCNTCFGGKKEMDNDRGRRGDGFSRQSFDRYPAQPRTSVEGGNFQGENEAIKKQLESLNAKVDRIVSLIEKMTHIAVPTISDTGKKATPATSSAKTKKVVKKGKK